MEPTANFCNHVANTLLKDTDWVFHDATTLDATIHMLNPHAAACNLLILGFLFIR